MIILDFETTGLVGPVALPLPKQPKIIEATLAELDDKTLKEVRRWTSLIGINEPVPDEISKSTGITTKMLANCEPFSTHLKTFVDFFLGQKIMAAHNCAFEVGCLESELRRLGRLTQFPWTPRRICTVEASFHLKKHRLKLGDLHEMATGKKFEGAHRTDADVTALAVVLRWLVKKGHLKI